MNIFFKFFIDLSERAKLMKKQETMCIDKLETVQAFEDYVSRGNGLKVVIFEASWSGSSHIILPALERLYQSSEVCMKKVCIEQNKAIATKYGIHKVPTILFFKSTTIIDHIIGMVPIILIQQKIEQHTR